MPVIKTLSAAEMPDFELYEVIRDYLYWTNSEFRKFIAENYSPEVDPVRVELDCHELLQLNIDTAEATNFSIGSEDIGNAKDLPPLILGGSKDRKGA